MQKVVLFGAGKSSCYLIKKFQEYSTICDLELSVIDTDVSKLPSDCKNHKNTRYYSLSISEKETVSQIMENQDLVISMLPAHLHIPIAELCLLKQKNLLTASYVSPQMQKLNTKATQKGLLFLNEMGVDPGLDHMSALSLIHQLKKQGAQITSFYSHTGGLVNNTNVNSWNYKFTWNPKNVIKAGAEGALYIKDQKETTIPYNAIFCSVTPVTINNNNYDSYPNRNSLAYAEKYHLKQLQNFYRGTLRHQGYCEAWNVFVQLKMTEDTTPLILNKLATRKDFLNHFLPLNSTIETSFCKRLNLTKANPIFKKFELLNFFNEEKKLALTKGTAAEILLHILKEDWQMQPNDTDLLVMQHQIEYTLNGIYYTTKSELSIAGVNQHYTAMAKTVGAPMFEAALMILNKQLNLTGVQIPTKAAIYQPILQRLTNHGLVFKTS